ncbi:MAG TPA: FAD-binding oxidoreductase [Solirubrobacterales bacterium]
MSPAPRMKWCGWGEPDRRLQIPDSARAVLHERLGPADPTPPVELADVKVKRRRSVPAAVLEAAGSDSASTEREDRIANAYGRGYVDLVRLRAGQLETAPDAVITPADADGVVAVIEACGREGVAVVPFGGGTSVVGGVEALRGDHRAVVSLDLRRMCGVRVDRASLTAELGPGLRGPQAESALGGHGLTLGHFPQSFEYATIGGFAATRSAGQASCGYGRFDEVVTSLRMATPAGELSTLRTPHTAAGPALRELALGSEGVLGVITSVTVRVRPAPEASRYEAWIAPSFEAGAEIFRELAQAGAMPDVLRLSDETETEVSLSLAGGGAGHKALGAYLGLRGRRDGCIVIAGWEGEPLAVERRRAVGVTTLRRGGAISLGTRGGESWKRGRYEGPYLRDELMDLGYLVETLETSQTWSRLSQTYEAVRGALSASLEAQGTPGMVWCHISHVYRDGASLYFTFVAPGRRGEEIEQWRAAKAAACDAIVATGATITHHHAVGRDHAPYMEAEVGAVGLEALRAVKDRLDPAGIMNPGKLLEGSDPKGTGRPAT